MTAPLRLAAVALLVVTALPAAACVPPGGAATAEGDRTPVGSPESPGVTDATEPVLSDGPTPTSRTTQAAGTPPGAVPPDVPEEGTGAFDVAPGDGPAAGSGSRLVRYSVEVEQPLAADPAQVAAVVDGILADPRSWPGVGDWRLARVGDPASADMRIRLATPLTADRLCAPLRTMGRLSCRQGPDVVLNAWRWVNGADSWGTDLVGYRTYLVNHEVGHFLGRGHVACPAAGAPAPVMMQQTKGVGACVPNAWPAVTGG